MIRLAGSTRPTSSRRLPAFLARCFALTLAVSAPALAAVSANKAFVPDVVSVGQVSKVTIFFLNANNNPAGSLAVTDAMPAGVVIAPTPNFATTCGGSAPALNPGDTQIAYSGGTIPANSGVTPGACQISFDVVTNTAGVYINTIAAGDVTSTEGPNSQSAEATLNVSTLAPIGGSKSFAPANVHGNGNPSTVTITLNNINGVALTNVTFTDVLPAAVLVAPTPAATNTCGGTLTAAAGATSILLAGGQINAANACTITFNVVAATPNTAQNTNNTTNTIPAGDITTAEGVINTLITSNTLRVQTGAAVAKSFSPNPMTSGSTSLLTITVTNYNASALAPLDLTDNLPAGLTVASPLTTGGTCLNSPTSASFHADTVAGGGVVGTESLAGVAMNAGNASTSCTFTIRVTATNASTTPATFPNTIPAGNFGGVNYASASSTLTVTAPSLLTASKTLTVPASAAAVQTGWVRATVNIANAYAFPISGLAMTDLLTTMGTGYTFGNEEAPTWNASCGAVFNAPGTTTASFTGATVPAGSTCTVTFPVHIGPTASTGTRTNTIPAGNITGTLDDGSAGGTPVANTANLSAQIGVSAALTLAKAYSPSTVLAGTDTRLTITISHNAGAVAFTNIQLTDAQPALHLISTNPDAQTTCGGMVTAVPGSGSVALSGGSLGTGTTSCTISVNVTTPAGAGSATNQIAAGAVITDQGVTNAVVNAPIARVTNFVTLAKSFDPATVALGPTATSTMRLRILNNQPGASALSGVALSDSLPPGMIVDSLPATPWSGAGCGPDPTITAPIGGTTVSVSGKTIAAGATCTIEVIVHPTAAGNLINAVGAMAVSSTEGVSNISPVAATLSSTGATDLSVTKTNHLTEVAAGTSFNYTVTVSNIAGGQDVAGATFVDNPPAGTTFTAWTCAPSGGGSGTCTANGSGPISDTVYIPAGQSIVYTITTSVPAGATGSIMNTATITAPPSVIDTNPNNNAASDTDPIVQTISLGISKTDNSLTYTPGGVGTYVMVVTNGGPSNASNLNFGDTLPAGVTIRAPGVSCTPAGTATCGSAGANTIGTDAVSYTAMTIAAGAGNQVTISVPVDYAPGMTTTPLVNTASVQRGTEPPVTANDSSTRAPDLDLDVDKDDGTATYQPGTNGTYTIIVSNDGLTTANSVSLADPLPAGVTIRAPGVTCSPTAGSNCGTVTGAASDTSLGTSGAVILPAGELTFTVPVTFGASMTASSITNTATATATDPELPPPGTLTAQDDDTNTLVLPDLTVDKSHTGSFFQGQVGAQFSIVASNVGTAPTLGTVTVTDTLPAGLTATAISGSGWACVLATLTCTRGDALAASASYPAILLTVDVAANATSPLQNLATVSGGGETNTSNNTDTDSVTVDLGPDLTIVKTHAGNFYQGQTGAQFTITVSNVGGTASVGTVNVSDTLPAGLTATAIAGSGWSCTQPAGPCTRSDTLATASSYPSIGLTVDVAANAGSPLVNNVVVSGGGDVNPNNNTASDTVTVDGGVDLTIAKTHAGNFVRGQTGAQFTITVSNVGGVASSGTVTVTDTLPAGLTATAIGGTGWICAQPVGPCTRDDALAAASAYPAITLTVNVALDAGSPLVNSTTVAGGGDINPANNTATDSVTVGRIGPPPASAVPVDSPAALLLLAAALAMFGARVARVRRGR